RPGVFGRVMGDGAAQGEQILFRVGRLRVAAPATSAAQRDAERERDHHERLVEFHDALRHFGVFWGDLLEGRRLWPLEAGGMDRAGPPAILAWQRARKLTGR